MNFKTPEDKKKVIAVLEFCYYPVCRLVKDILVDKGFVVVVEEKENRLRTAYKIILPGTNRGGILFLQNLFLEIATKDRDTKLLEFDEKLVDFKYFLFKTTKVVKAKLNPILVMMRQESPEKAMEKVMKLGSEYARMKVLRVSRKDEKGDNKNEHRRPQS